MDELLSYLCECNCCCKLRWETDEAWEFIRIKYIGMDRDKLNIIHPDCLCKEFDVDELYVTISDSSDSTSQIKILHLPEELG